MAQTCALHLLILASFLVSRVCHADSDLHLKSLLSDQQLARNTISKELENAQLQLSSLEKKFLEKEANLFHKDKIISSLEDKLQAIQEGGSKQVEAMLDRAKGKLKQLVEKATKLEETLKEKGVELLKFKDQVQMLEAAGKRQMSQYTELEKVSEDQRKQIDDAERALQAVREAVRKAATQFDSKNEDLIKAHTQWLPPWASKYVSHLQTSLSNQWSTRGRPLFNPVISKVSEKTLMIQRWSKGRFQAMKMNAEQMWSSALKQWWEDAHLKVTSRATTLKEKAKEGFEVTKAFLSPQLIKAQTYTKKTLQVARKSSRPYMEKAFAVFQPYFNQTQVLCKPYTAKITQKYNKYIKYAVKYHLQLQSRVRKTLRNNYLASIASKELVWFLASALLIMPLYGGLMLLSAVFRDRKHSTYAKGVGSHGHRKVKHSRQVNK